MDRLKDKVALVTGAASGIGRATALLFAREGARVILTDIAGSGEQVVQELRAAGGHGLFLLHDVTDEVAWNKVMSRIYESHGRLDILVNNAGTATSRAVTDLSLGEWREQLAVNLDSVFLGTKYAVRTMRLGKRGGSIVNVSSVSGLVGSPGTCAYSASKGGVRTLSKAVAMECAQDGIRVNCVLPGGVRTPIWQTADWWKGFVDKVGSEDEAWKQLEASAPMGRMGEPEDIAEAILYLASDASRYVTGSELVVDGGYTAR
ncbi:SDR family NAD(P)-dependent oxidoreductase [Archangium primigenium]|uniref:SDR family NAD(P)-dependent oxidoreductase n=1 Tax=[Archangium] primigenium TaxID=2792470 RepID=UPI00195B2593|nr:SDR family NAD(P)-dependent oxidoreductase [Archangium primigenium]MBM7112624.1 SDR family oxidoreductase [Archangium primigenium]